MKQLHSTDSWEQWRREKQSRELELSKCPSCEEIILEYEEVLRPETVTMLNGPNYTRYVAYHFSCSEEAS